jgi:hypothetical protein
MSGQAHQTQAVPQVPDAAINFKSRERVYLIAIGGGGRTSAV